MVCDSRDEVSSLWLLMTGSQHKAW